MWQGEKSFAFQLEVELFAQVKWDAHGATIFSKAPACPRADCDCTWDIENDDPKLNVKSLRCGLAHALDEAGIPATIPNTDVGLTSRDPLTMWLIDHNDDHPTSQYEKMLLDEFYPVRLISRIIDISDPNLSAEIEKVFTTIKSVCLIESGTDLDCSTHVRVLRTNLAASTIDPWGSFDLLNMGMTCLMYGQAMFDMIPPAQRATPSAAGIMARPIDNNTHDQRRDFILRTDDGGQASWSTVYNYLNKNIHHTDKTLAQATEWLVTFISSFHSTPAWSFRPPIAGDGDITEFGAFEFRLPAGTIDPKWVCHWVSFAIGFIISTDFEDYMGYSKHAWDTLDARLDKLNGNQHMSLPDLQDYIRQAWKVCKICRLDSNSVSERLQAMLFDPLMVYES